MERKKIIEVLKKHAITKTDVGNVIFADEIEAITDELLEQPEMTDEMIEKKGFEEFGLQSGDESMTYFIEGAKWMREQMKP